MRALLLLSLLGLGACAQTPPTLGGHVGPSPEPVAPSKAVSAEPPAPPKTDEEKRLEELRYIPERTYQLKELERRTLKVVPAPAAKKPEKDEIKAWIADTVGTRTEGLMFVREEDMRSDEAMLFVFGRVQPMSFWMKNTLQPLDIAYLRRDGTVINTKQMLVEPDPSNPQPRDYFSAAPALYALEMPLGSFKKFGIQQNARIVIPPDIKSKDNG